MNAAPTTARARPGRLTLLAAMLVVGLIIGRYVLPAAAERDPDGAAAAQVAGHAGTTHDASDPRAAMPAPAPAATVVWTCSMHPQIRMDRPGDCPLCGMALVPATSSASGDGSVQLSESSQRVASIEVVTIGRRPLEHELRTVGRIEFAEPLVAYVTARTAARVERVYADFTGTTVSAGDHLVDLYAPELVVAQQELLSSRAAGGEDIARRKLELLGVSAAQIDAVLAEGKPRDVLTVHAPVGGTVIEKNVREQAYVQVGDPLYTIADLSTVWMFADIYEFELPWVAIGQHVEVHIEGAPGDSFGGTVAFIEPVVREATRTVRVRVNLPNPDGRLKPGMFASATIRAALDATGRAAPSPLAGKWVCPMHPDVASDVPGACPLCGMDLQKVPDRAGAADDAGSSDDASTSHGPSTPHGAGAVTNAEHWVCPMNDQPPADAPGRCAVCGMKLVSAAQPPDRADADAAAAAAGVANLLAVPSTAVLDTGLRQIVWVEREPGRYIAAEVRLGVRAGDFYPVLDGLSEGDRVVVHGNFLLDSQAQIEGQPSLLYPRGLDVTGESTTHAGHAGHDGR